jgi:hypothetical protein
METLKCKKCGRDATFNGQNRLSSWTLLSCPVGQSTLDITYKDQPNCPCCDPRAYGICMHAVTTGECPHQQRCRVGQHNLGRIVHNERKFHKCTECERPGIFVASAFDAASAGNHWQVDGKMELFKTTPTPSPSPSPSPLASASASASAQHRQKYCPKCKPNIYGLCYHHMHADRGCNKTREQCPLLHIFLD